MKETFVKAAVIAIVLSLGIGTALAEVRVALPDSDHREGLCQTWCLPAEKKCKDNSHKQAVRPDQVECSVSQTRPQPSLSLPESLRQEYFPDAKPKCSLPQKKSPIKNPF